MQLFFLRLGPIWAIVLANLWWGISPVYWHELAALPALFVLSSRVVCSRIALQFIPIEIPLEQRSPNWRLALVTAALISLNWGLYIYAILHGETVQASLGYFLLPLMAVGFAALWYKEVLSRYDLAAVVLAVVGVFFVAVKGEGVPVIALGLALSMLFYTAIYRSSGIHPVVGLRAETTWLVPFALGYIIWSWEEVGISMSSSELVFLMLSGVVTVVPQYLFLSAVKEIDFASVGFLQFIVPLAKLIVAVTVLGEALSRADIVSFSLILVGVTLYCYGRYFRPTKLGIRVLS